MERIPNHKVVFLQLMEAFEAQPVKGVKVEVFRDANGTGPINRATIHISKGDVRRTLIIEAAAKSEYDTLLTAHDCDAQVTGQSAVWSKTKVMAVGFSCEKEAKWITLRSIWQALLTPVVQAVDPNLIITLPKAEENYYNKSVAVIQYENSDRHWDLAINGISANIGDPVKFIQPSPDKIRNISDEVRKCTAEWKFKSEQEKNLVELIAEKLTAKGIECEYEEESLDVDKITIFKTEDEDYSVRWNPSTHEIIFDSHVQDTPVSMSAKNWKEFQKVLKITEEITTSVKTAMQKPILKSITNPVNVASEIELE